MKLFRPLRSLISESFALAHSKNWLQKSKPLLEKFGILRISSNPYLFSPINPHCRNTSSAFAPSLQSRLMRCPNNSPRSTIDISSWALMPAAARRW